MRWPRSVCSEFTDGAPVNKCVICRCDMDDDLRHRYAPRRNKRYAHLRCLDEEARWAETLEWQTNDGDFYQLTRSILDRLDSEYREKWGLRVDQLASAGDIRSCLQTCRAWYEEEEALFKRAGVYVFMLLNMDLWLGGKASDVLAIRGGRS